MSWMKVTMGVATPRKVDSTSARLSCRLAGASQRTTSQGTDTALRTQRAVKCMLAHTGSQALARWGVPWLQRPRPGFHRSTATHQVRKVVQVARIRQAQLKRFSGAYLRS